MTSLLVRDVDDYPETLLAGQVWTSEAVRVADYSAVTIATASDAPGDFVVQFSVNGRDWDSNLPYSYAPGVTFVPHVLQVTRGWMRVVYTNGSTAQGWHRLEVLASIKNPLSSPLGTVIERQSDALTVRTISEEIAIADGLFAGRTLINKLGLNSDVDSGTEDIWGGGGLYTGQPASNPIETVEVRSTSTADVMTSGTGAWSMTFLGLNGDGVLTGSPVVELNGTTWVTVPTLLWRRVFFARVTAAGSGGTNAGNIEVRHTTSTGNVFISIPPGFGRSQTGAFTVPANTTGRLKRIWASIGKDAGGQEPQASMQLMLRRPGGVYEVVHPYRISASASLDVTLYGGILVPALSDIVWRATVTVDNCYIAAGFDVLLNQSG